MPKGITLGELAELAGVSPATVSIVLNKRPLAGRIAEKTKAKIITLAEQVHYRPNQLAKAMKTQSTGIIGFICGGIAEPFYAQLCSELTFQAEKEGYRLMAMLTEWDFQKELDALELLLSKTVDGVLMLSSAFSEENERTRPFRKPDMPLVMLSELPCNGCSSVQSDYNTGMRRLFELLAADGYSRTALLEYPEYPAKREAYCAAARRHGMRETLFSFVRGSGHIRKTVDKILTDLPEVLIVASDYECMGVVSELIQRGVRVPDDLSVVSIDGTDFCRIFNPPLTAICHDFPLFAHRALALLKQKIAGAHEIVNERIPTRLMPGKSLKLRAYQRINMNV